MLNFLASNFHINICNYYHELPVLFLMVHNYIEKITCEYTRVYTYFEILFCARRSCVQTKHTQLTGDQEAGESDQLQPVVHDDVLVHEPVDQQHGQEASIA